MERTNYMGNIYVCNLLNNIQIILRVRNLRSAVSHFLRGGRSAPGASHFLRGRKDLDDGELADEDEDPYLRGLRGNSISHFLRGRR